MDPFDRHLHQGELFPNLPRSDPFSHLYPNVHFGIFNIPFQNTFSTSSQWSSTNATLHHQDQHLCAALETRPPFQPYFPTQQQYHNCPVQYAFSPSGLHTPQYPPSNVRLQPYSNSPIYDYVNSSCQNFYHLDSYSTSSVSDCLSSTPSNFPQPVLLSGAQTSEISFPSPLDSSFPKLSPRPLRTKREKSQKKEADLTTPSVVQELAFVSFERPKRGRPRKILKNSNGDAVVLTKNLNKVKKKKVSNLAQHQKFNSVMSVVLTSDLPSSQSWNGPLSSSQSSNLSVATTVLNDSERKGQSQAFVIECAGSTPVQSEDGSTTKSNQVNHANFATKPMTLTHSRTMSVSGKPDIPIRPTSQPDITFKTFSQPLRPASQPLRPSSSKTGPSFQMTPTSGPLQRAMSTSFIRPGSGKPGELLISPPSRVSESTLEKLGRCGIDKTEFWKRMGETKHLWKGGGEPNTSNLVVGSKSNESDKTPYDATNVYIVDPNIDKLMKEREKSFSISATFSKIVGGEETAGVLNRKVGMEEAVMLREVEQKKKESLERKEKRLELLSGFEASPSGQAELMEEEAKFKEAAQLKVKGKGLMSRFLENRDGTRDELLRNELGKKTTGVNLELPIEFEEMEVSIRQPPTEMDDLPVDTIYVSPVSSVEEPLASSELPTTRKRKASCLPSPPGVSKKSRVDRESETENEPRASQRVDSSSASKAAIQLYATSSRFSTAPSLFDSDSAPTFTESSPDLEPTITPVKSKPIMIEGVYLPPPERADPVVSIERCEAMFVSRGKQKGQHGFGKPSTQEQQAFHNSMTHKAPELTYWQLIVEALWYVPGRKLTLHDIYIHIMSRNPFYIELIEKSYPCPDWKNSIRHNLSTNKEFLIKMPHPEKGDKNSHLWCLNMKALAKASGGPFNPVKAKKSVDTRGEKRESPNKKSGSSGTLLAPPPFVSARSLSYGQIPSSPIVAASPKRTRGGRRKRNVQDVVAPLYEEEEDQQEEEEQPEGLSYEDLELDEEDEEDEEGDDAFGDAGDNVYSEDELLDFQFTYEDEQSTSRFVFSNPPGSPTRKNVRCATPPYQSSSGNLAPSIFRTPTSAQISSFAANQALLFTPDPNSKATPGIHERARSKSGQYRPTVMGSPRATFKSSSPVRNLRRLGYDDDVLFRTYPTADQLRAAEKTLPEAWRSDYVMDQTPSDTPARIRANSDYMMYAGKTPNLFGSSSNFTEDELVLSTPKGFPSFRGLWTEEEET